jgi:hypothetical protein
MTQKKPPPTNEMSDVVKCYNSRSKQLINGCNANAHHIPCGITDINPTGESLVEYLVYSHLDILNRNNKPNRKKVINLTQRTNHIGNLVKDWCVSDEPSL